MPSAGAVPSLLATMRYEIRVKGVLDTHWSDWFEGLSLRGEGGTTVIAGPIPDQAALHGVLAKVRDLGLPLLSVHRVDPDQPDRRRRGRRRIPG
jgi:hypothetical protein